jgi:uncharacterized protein YgbK (DUF1537 family)
MAAGPIGAVADDLTGAAELAAVGWRRGLGAEVHTEPGQDPVAPLAVLDTDSRTRGEDDARERVRAAGHRLAARRPSLVYKKVDSVLRGWARAETEALLEGLGWSRAILVPANPGLGRVIRGGCYYVEGRPVHETDFARDPLHPIRSSDVGEMLGRNGTRPVAVARPGAAPLAEGLTIGEAASREDLSAWAAAVDETVLAGGGSEFFDALLEARGLVRRADVPAPPPEPSDRRLFVSGTTSDRSRRARQTARELGVPVLPMPDRLFHADGAAPELVDGWADDAAAAFDHSPTVVVTIDRPLSRDRAAARRLEGVLADVVAAVRARREVSGIYAEGGATAAAIIRRLGWTRLTVVRELAPGVATMDTGGRPGGQITLKPGSYAWPESIWTVR